MSAFPDQHRINIIQKDWLKGAIINVLAFLTLWQTPSYLGFYYKITFSELNKHCPTISLQNINSYDAEPFGSPWFVDIWNQLSKMKYAIWYYALQLSYNIISLIIIWRY